MIVVKITLPPMMIPCSKKPTVEPFFGLHTVGRSATASSSNFRINSALGFVVRSEAIVDDSADGLMYSGCGMVNHDVG
jgi:hypothetical protein